MNFKERYLRGDCSIDTVNDWSKFWHDGIPRGQTLREFLGLSEEEYQAWLAGGDAALAKAITGLSAPRYIAVHLEWDELGRQLEELVRQLLLMDCKVSINRVEYYYWEMHLDIPVDVDEELSTKICERLELQDVDPDFFCGDDSVDKSQMLRLLERLTGYEVSSSHADDDGVWMICKEYRTSSQGYAASLIARCEKRLQSELSSRHYPTVNRETARHQLFGFKEALKQLGILPEEQWIVYPDHFSDHRSIRDDGAVENRESVDTDCLSSGNGG